MPDRPPVIFLAFANDRDDRARYLRNLPEEVRRVRERLTNLETAGLCEVEVRTNVTVGELLDVFSDPRYRDRIAVFHFGGHAGGYQLVLESAQGLPELAHAAGLADFLGHQRGLQLVFLNGCSTEPQVEALLQSGIPAVIATSEAIDDAAATELSVRFYTALAGGATLAAAYAEAAAAVKTTKGGRTRDLYRVEAVEADAADRWPWGLHVKDGDDVVREWSLPKAAGDPLFGLSPLPEHDLPETPYRHLQWFREEDAELFFGRGREIRAFYEMATSPSAAPLVLFYGQSGVGKSSMLAAGLVSRLASSHQVRYARRQRELGLTGTLLAALGAHGPDATLTEMWHAIESEAAQPLVVILDQVEEAYTRPRLEDPEELKRFVRMLSETFADRSARPRGKLVLGFRKEWLADLEERLREGKIPRSKTYLERLDRNGIIEIVEGPARSERLRRQFNLTIEPGLAELIADDLLEDRGAPVAPTLEVLLTKMWTQAMARNAHGPTFATELYQELRSKGLLLDDFVDEQLNALRDWNAKLVETGLALDLLAFHTTPLGTAEFRARDEVVAAYSHRKSALPELLQQSKDLYLLVDHESQRQGPGINGDGTRLAHDTLAPLVRRRFKDSDMPGQRARRILENRAGEWREGKTGSPLDETDLATVEKGEAGMTGWSADEERLIQASRKRRAEDRRKRRTQRGLATVGAAVIAGLCVAALYFGRQAQRQAAQVRAAAILASAAAQEDPLVAALMVGSMVGYAEPMRGADIAAGLARTALPIAVLGHRSSLISAAFTPDGRRVVTASSDATARVWNADGSGTPLVLGKFLPSGMSAAVSPDGRRVVIGLDDGTARVWNTDESSAPVVLAGHSGGVIRAAFSPDGQRVVTASDDTTARVWNADGSGSPVVLRGHQDQLMGAVFSPDGQRVVTASRDETARVWNADGSGTPVVLAGHNGEVISAAFSPDGRRIVTGLATGQALVWNADGSGAPLVLKGGSFWVNTAAFSPDGRRIVTALEDQTVRVWKSDRRSFPVVLTGHKGSVNTAAFSPDGQRIVTASRDATARVWNADGSGTPVVLAGHNGEVISAAFSPDGHRVITASADGTARVWNADGSGMPVMLTGHRGEVTSDFSPDGRQVVTASVDSTARVWNADGSGTPAVLTGHRGNVWRAAFSPDGGRVVTASSDGTARVWNADGSGTPVVLTVDHGNVWSAAFSSDGERVVTASSDGTARVWNADGSGAPVSLPGNGMMMSAAFSLDGRRVVTGSGDSTARVWNADGSGAPVVLTGQSGELYTTALSPDGRRVVTGSSDGMVRVWNADGSGAPVVLAGHGDRVTSAAFSPDGRRVVTSSADGTARVWNTDGSGVPVVLAGHAGGVTSAAFSPDGRRVVTASEMDKTARVWNADGSGAPVVLAGHAGGVTSAAFSPDGRRVVTGSGRGTVRVSMVTWESLVEFLRSATTACLTQEQRERLLAETERQARAKYDDCEREHGRPGHGGADHP